MKIKKILFIFLLIGSIFIVATPLLAADEGTNLPNPLGSSNLTVPQVTGRIINSVLGIVGSIALVIFIVGGFQWMTAGGNEEKVKKGRNTLVWATLGLAVIFMAYAILKFVFETLVTST